MRKIIYSLWTLGCIIFITGCGTDETSQLSEELLNQLQDTTIPNDLGGVYDGSLRLPTGTKPIVSADKSTLQYELPDGVVYVARDQGKLSVASIGSFTCTSKCSGGCDVIKLGQQLGCSACPEGSTESCVGSRSLAGFAIGDGQGGGFIDLAKGVSFVTELKTYSQLDGPDWDVLMSYPDVEQAFESFFETDWGKHNPETESDGLALVNVFGTLIRMKVPSVLSTSGREAVLAAEKVTCECDSGAKGCKHEEVKKGFIKVGDKCVAGECTSCTMKF